MTDSSNEQTQSLAVDARVRGEETAKPWNASLWRLLGEVVALLPTYRDSREGRNKRNSIKLVILVIGAGLLFAGGTADTAVALWLTLGALIAASALVLPIEELKKRTWRTKIRKKQEPRTTAVWGQGRVVHDGRRVELHLGDDRVGYVSVRKGKHKVEVRRCDGETCLGVLPMSRKVKDAVWVCTKDEVGGEASGTVEADEMDHPARVDGADWERLWEMLSDET